MVYLMRRREDGNFYAGKYQRLSQTERWDGVREAWLLNKLQDCKFVIKMIEFYQSPEESVIVTEYLEGSDLFASLSEAEFELTEAKCRVIVSQVLDALVYIHRLRVVHMDIKPNNILLASKDKNNLKGALKDYSKAIDIDASFAMAYYNRGLVYYNLDNAPKALEDWQKALSVNKKYTDVYLARAFVHQEREDCY